MSSQSLDAALQQAGNRNDNFPTCVQQKCVRHTCTSSVLDAALQQAGKYNNDFPGCGSSRATAACLLLPSSKQGKRTIFQCVSSLQTANFRDLTSSSLSHGDFRYPHRMLWPYCYGRVVRWELWEGVVGLSSIIIFLHLRTDHLIMCLLPDVAIESSADVS